MRVLALLYCCALAAPAVEPLRVADGQFVTPTGQPVGLFGANLYQTHMMYARLQDPAPGLASLQAMAALGFNFVRLPLSAGFIMPAEGVLPDHPEYAAALARHGLKPGYPALLDQLLDECARLGLYALLEFHEYPRDPYRWFTGGEERRRQTGEPGGGIDWMSGEGMVRRYTPVMLGWLAARWRGRPEILGFEVPHNEPHGDGPDATGDGLKAFAGECAAAVKAADPGRLCVLAVGDWGAGVNRLDDSFVWDLAPGIDAVTPHFYLGMHNNASPIAFAYGVSAVSWLSWFRGSGKPILVGEWGDAHIEHPRFQKFDDGPRLTQRLTDACLAGWLLAGAQGVARWAWHDGIDDPDRRHRLGQQAAAMLKYTQPWITAPVGRAEVAVVVQSRRRAQYGAPSDLVRIAARLLDCRVTPFDTLFAAQVTAQPEVLERYRAVLVYSPDLPAEVAGLVAASGRPHLALADDREALDAIAPWLAAQGLTVAAPPTTLWEFAAGAGRAVFNRTADAGSYTAEVPAGQHVIDRLSGEVLATGPAPLRLQLGPFESADLLWLTSGEQPPHLPVATPPPPPDESRLTLYDHGGTRGRWPAGWGGGQATVAQVDGVGEVIRVTASGHAQLGGFNLNNHEPLDLRPWLGQPEAAVEVRLRVISGEPARLVVRLAGRPGEATGEVALAGGGDWQTVRLPLATLRPAGRPEAVTGLLLGLLPGGQCEVAGVALTSR